MTLEDLIEELVGEIVDEFDDEETPVEHLANGGLRVSARLAVDEVNDLLPADLPTGAWDTVGGLVFDLLGHVPVAGESVACEGLRLEVDRVTGRRIDRVPSCRWPRPTARRRTPARRVGERLPFGVRGRGRPSQRRQVDARQRHGGDQGDHRVAAAEHHALPGARRAQPARRPGRVVDTPGLHKPKTALGERMNESATSSLDDVDAVVALVEATGAVGPGDRMVLDHSVRHVRAMARAAALSAELAPDGSGGRPAGRRCSWWSTRSTGWGATACSAT